MTSGSPCQHCYGTGWLPVEVDGGYRSVIRCAQCLPKEINLERYGIMPEHGRARLSDFAAPVQEFCGGLLESPCTSAIICGTTGSGKTHLMAALCREHLRAGRSLVWFLARGLLRRLWATYNPQANETEGQLIDELAAADVLAIDDLGKEGRVSDAGLGAFHEMLSRRNGCTKLTYVTTNLSSEQIGDVYDPAIRSRLTAWPSIIMAGKDRRLKPLKA